jgi:hypothetical protein
MQKKERKNRQTKAKLHDGEFPAISRFPTINVLGTWAASTSVKRGDVAWCAGA